MGLLSTSITMRYSSLLGRTLLVTLIALLASRAVADSGSAAPQPVRGKRNEPANVVDTFAALAQARGEEPAELERQIERNASACFGL